MRNLDASHNGAYTHEHRLLVPGTRRDRNLKILLGTPPINVQIPPHHTLHPTSPRQPHQTMCRSVTTTPGCSPTIQWSLCSNTKSLVNYCRTPILHHVAPSPVKGAHACRLHRASQRPQRAPTSLLQKARPGLEGFTVRQLRHYDPALPLSARELLRGSLDDSEVAFRSSTHCVFCGAGSGQRSVRSRSSDASPRHGDGVAVGHGDELQLIVLSQQAHALHHALLVPAGCRAPCRGPTRAPAAPQKCCPA